MTVTMVVFYECGAIDMLPLPRPPCDGFATYSRADVPVDDCSRIRDAWLSSGHSIDHIHIGFGLVSLEVGA